MHAGEKPTQVKADSEVNHQGRPEKRCSPNDPWTLTCVCGFSLTHLLPSSRCCPGSTSTSAPLPSTLEKTLMNALGVQVLKPRRRVNRPGKRESTASSHAAAHGEAIALLQTAHAFTQSKAHGRVSFHREECLQGPVQDLMQQSHQGTLSVFCLP